MFHRLNGTGWIVLAGVIAALSWSGTARAQQAGPTPGQAKARQILQDMAGFLASREHFQVDLSCGYDALQSSGHKIEFLDERTLTVRRPDSLRLQVRRSDGNESVAFLNPKTITVVDETTNVFAQTEGKASLDASIEYFLQELQMPLPLAMLLVSRLPEELSRRVTYADYVEQTNILGEPAHHIVGSTATVDFQVWIDAGKKPLMRRLVLTYPGAPGQPQFRASFSNWDLSPSVRDSVFTPRIAAGAKRIAFLNQIAIGAPAAAEGAGR